MTANNILSHGRREYYQNIRVYSFNGFIHPFLKLPAMEKGCGQRFPPNQTAKHSQVRHFFVQASKTACLTNFLKLFDILPIIFIVNEAPKMKIVTLAQTFYKLKYPYFFTFIGWIGNTLG